MAEPKVQNGTVRLSASQWISLMVVIIGGLFAAVTGFYAAIHKLESTLQTQINDLDQKWQDRTETLVKQMNQSIQDLRDQIPPAWFEALVDSHTRELLKVNRETAALTVRVEQLENRKD